MTVYYADSSALVKRFLEHTLLRQDLPGLILVSADQDLLTAAQAEGLLTDNPNLHA